MCSNVPLNRDTMKQSTIMSIALSLGILVGSPQSTYGNPQKMVEPSEDPSQTYSLEMPTEEAVMELSNLLIADIKAHYGEEYFLVHQKKFTPISFSMIASGWTPESYKDYKDNAAAIIKQSGIPSDALSREIVPSLDSIFKPTVRTITDTEGIMYSFHPGTGSPEPTSLSMGDDGVLSIMVDFAFYPPMIPFVTLSDEVPTMMIGAIFAELSQEDYIAREVAAIHFANAFASEDSPKESMFAALNVEYEEVAGISLHDDMARFDHLQGKDIRMPSVGELTIVEHYVIDTLVKAFVHQGANTAGEDSSDFRYRVFAYVGDKLTTFASSTSYPVLEFAQTTALTSGFNDTYGFNDDMDGWFPHADQQIDLLSRRGLINSQLDLDYRDLSRMLTNVYLVSRDNNSIRDILSGSQAH